MQPKTKAFEEITIPVGGMSCGSCVRHIRAALDENPGVKDVEVNLAQGEATVLFDPEATGVEAIIRTIRKIGYRAETPSNSDGSSPSKPE